MTPSDIALASLPPVLWAITYIIAKPAMAHFPPMLLVGIVYALTAVVLNLPWRPWRTPLWAILASAILGGAVQSAFIWTGISLVPASMAILVVQCQVPFAVLAAWAFGHETMNPRRLAGIAVCLAGVAVVVGAPGSLGETSGLVLIVLGTAAWGLAQAVIRITSRDSGSRMTGAVAVWAAPPLLVLSAIFESGQIRALVTADWLDWSAVAALVVCGYVAPYSIWYALLRRFRVDQITPFALLMPIAGVLAGAAFLHERPSLLALAGGAIIVLGLAVVARAPARQVPEVAPGD